MTHHLRLARSPSRFGSAAATALGPAGLALLAGCDSPAAVSPSPSAPASSSGSASQDLDSFACKILRMTPDGGVPAGNPFAESPVYSYGHRNVQVLTFDSSGQLWASEFGQDTWDELNKIEAGENYGWPLVEGTSTDARFLNFFHQWRTADASPSGIAIAGDTAYRSLWLLTNNTDGRGSPRPGDDRIVRVPLPR